MKKHKENLFAEKFHLLNSQESQEITWSSSGSSDFENISSNVEKLGNITNKKSRKRKRKQIVPKNISRSSSGSSDFENISSNVEKLGNITNKKSRKRKRKQIVPKNISNLDVTIVDVHKDVRNAAVESNIPIPKTEVEFSGPKSPILTSTQYFSPYKCKNISTSPIISSKSFENKSKVTSPILILKTASPKISPNIRRKLFKREQVLNEKETVVISRGNSFVLNNTYSLDRRKVNNLDQYSKVNIKVDKFVTDQNNYESEQQEQKNEKITSMINNQITKIEQELLPQKSKILGNLDEHILESQNNNQVINETPELLNMNDSVSMLKTSNVDLAKKVQSYFECHFSSDNASQNTISEISTPKNDSKSSDEIEIISTMTQVVSNKNSTESIKAENDGELNKKEKKIRYKKDGLAYRLNLLVKKQTASISLWHHEKFLAANSIFFIPKGEFIAFRICKVHFKYGCHLLEAMDIHDNIFFILINSSLMTTDIISINSIVKLYEPYKIIDLSHNCKYVINVVKFECVNMK